jgi:hypothetical protein
MYTGNVECSNGSWQSKSCHQNLADNMLKFPVFWDVQIFSLVDVQGCFAEIAASVIRVKE